jgi:hypothetical protein
LECKLRGLASPDDLLIVDKDANEEDIKLITKSMFNGPTDVP